MIKNSIRIIRFPLTACIFFLAVCLAYAVDAPPQEIKKERDWLAVPVIISNPALGTGGGAMGMYFFDIGRRTEGMSRSALTAVGIYTDTDSYVGGVGGNLFMLEDKLRVLAGLFKAHINNDFRDPLGESVEFATDMTGFYANLKYRVLGDHFLGGHGKFFRTEYDPQSDNARDYLDYVGAEDTIVGGIGPVYTYDTRDHTRFPTRGILMELNGIYNPDAWGNEENYSTVDGAFNLYHSLKPGKIIATRIFGHTGSDETPYSDKAKLGMRSDLRGFKAGEIVGQTMVSAQAEYRWRLYKKWGVVFFGGLAKLWDDDPNQEQILKDLYYSAGTGIRYRLSEENGINLRIDIAVGNDDNMGWYIGLGEAF